MTQTDTISIGVLALQGAFSEHIQLLRAAAATRSHIGESTSRWRFLEVRTISELDQCDALIVPGGESTTISLIAERCGLLEPLRNFVKVHRKPTWGTCAGLILLAESANRTKKGGQELIGGLDVRVNRNHFGRQTESFEASLDLPFLSDIQDSVPLRPFHTVFIRAPIVEKTLAHHEGIQTEEAEKDDTVVAPSKQPIDETAAAEVKSKVEVLARLPHKHTNVRPTGSDSQTEEHEGDIVAVRQGNCFGTSFHPELTNDCRIHAWWLEQVVRSVEARKAG